MGTHALWLLLLTYLGYNHPFGNRASKRSIETSEKCQMSESQNSFLWVMKRTPPVYFFGTIHVPYTKVWDYVPLNSKQAFYNTNNIYFELDLTDTETRRALSQCQMLPKGVKLRDVVPITMYKRIKRHLAYIRKVLPEWMTHDQKTMGLTASNMYRALTRNWHRKRAIWIMVMLNALTEYDMKDRGISVLDMYLIREAVSRIKHTGSIESVQEQCAPLNALNNSQVMTALNQTLTLHEKIRRGKATVIQSTKKLIYHYNCGDLSKVLSAQDMPNMANLENSTFSNSDIEETRKFDEYLREELLYKRNQRMARRVKQRILEQPNQSFFFAFGAGHFLGNGSIIDLLRQEGYNISHVRHDESLPSYGLARRIKSSGRKNKEKKKRLLQKRKRRRRRKQKYNVDNLWKRDPSWKVTLTTRSPVNSDPPTTTMRRNSRFTQTLRSSASHFRQTSHLWTKLLIIYLSINLFCS